MVVLRYPYSHYGRNLSMSPNNNLHIPCNILCNLQYSLNICPYIHRHNY